MRLKRPLPNGSRAGFSLLEILITVTIFAGLLAVFSLSLRTAAVDEHNQVHLSQVRERGEKALLEIREVLTQTQFVAGFPVPFDGNTIGATHAALAHAAADVPPAVPAPRELAFLTPADANGDGWPDLTAGGSIAWSADPSAITLERNADGTNRVRVVRPDGVGRTIARGVRSVVIDTSATAAFAIPLQALQVTVHMDRNPNQIDLPPETLQTTLLLSRDDLLP